MQTCTSESGLRECSGRSSKSERIVTKREPVTVKTGQLTTKGNQPVAIASKANPEGKNELGLAERLQEFADGYWFPDGIAEEHPRPMVVGSFTRKSQSEMQMMDVQVHRSQKQA